MIRKLPDDSDRNYDIVHMIKKIAIGLESKNVDDLQAIAHELEGWVPHGNWGKLDVKTKVFVEHILMALGRLQLGFELLDKGAGELTDIRQKMEKDEIHGLTEEGKTGFVCFKCGQRKIGSAVLEDIVGNKMCDRCARALGGKELRGLQDLVDDAEYDKLEREVNGLAQGITTENIDEFCKRNLDSVDEKNKFTCEKCGERKRRSAPGASNCKEVDGYTICGRCYRDFRNWFVKTDKKLDDFWVENDKLSRDEREKKLGDLHKKISWMKENFGFRDKKGIDWNRYHKKRRGRFKKDELSDEEKDDLK